MSITDSQYQRLLARVTALEEHHNDVVVAMDAFATLDQVQELLVLVQTRIETLEDAVEALEERVTAIEEEPLT